MGITTIKLQKETKDRIEKLRENKRESYDDILRKVLYVLNMTRDNPNKAKSFLEKIDEVKLRAEEEAKHDKAEIKKLKKEKREEEKQKKTN